MATLAQRLQAEIDRANATTSKTDTTVHNAVSSLIGGYGQGGKEQVEWHQCPEAPRNFINNVTYDPNDYSTSQIENYAPTPALESNTKPIGKTVDGVTYYNEVPNIATPFASTNASGTLKPLDQLRWINTTSIDFVDGVNSFTSKADLLSYVSQHSNEIEYNTIFRVYPDESRPEMPDYEKYYIWENELKFFSYFGPGANTRDLGGWQCDGGTIQYGKLVRGGETNPNDKDLMVNEIGIKTEVRLFEKALQGLDHSVWGIDMIVNPTGTVIAYNLTDKVMWKAILNGILTSVVRDKPVYFHCGAGADRTGTAAIMLEAILGVSESDISKDFEITSFSGAMRPRTDIATFISKIKQVPLIGGLSDTFRNHAISWALSCGVEIDLINAFRQTCVNGNPDIITVSIPAYSITNNLTYVTTDNDNTSVYENQPYEARIEPQNGYIINSVAITMGGVDVTQYFDGEIGNLNRSVTLNLQHCSINNTKQTVIDGQGYAAEVTVSDGYTLDGATVSITMGGTNITNQVYIEY